MAGSLSITELEAIVMIAEALGKLEASSSIHLAGPIRLIAEGSGDPVGELDSVDGDWQFRA